MLLSTAHPWERRRRPVLLVLLLFSVSGFLAGIEVGLFILPIGIPLLSAFGFILVRPVDADPERAGLVSRLVLGACLAPVVALLALAVVTVVASSATLPAGLTFESLAIVSGLLVASLGSAAAGYYVLRRRGTVADRRRAGRISWGVVFGVSWFILFWVLDLAFARPQQTIDLGAIANMGGAILPASWLVHQAFVFWRVWSPAKAAIDPVAEARRAVTTPTFRSFGRT